MNTSPAQGYAQARMQSRYAGLPEPVLWSDLGQAGGVGHFLQQAGAAGLGPWLATLGVDSTPQAVEIALREQFRQVVRDTSGWMPKPWRPATRWFALLVDLEPIRIIAGGEPCPDWFRDDPFLTVLANDPGAWPLPELALVDADGAALAARWRVLWRRYCPAVSAREQTGLAALDALMPVVAYDSALVARLQHSFRRFAGSPIAAFGFLALVLCDVMRLRGELLSRIGFAGSGD